ncbi:MAG TPA: hypothetical protein VLM36_12840 [Sphingomicrobium sp.]|nr:hypothetical protein [Sphingomicrobium sp.]
MLEPLTAYRLVRGKTRCHPYIADICTYFAVTFDGVASRLGYSQSDDSHVVMACPGANADIALPLKGFADGVIEGGSPDEIIVRYERKGPSPNGKGAPGMEGLTGRVVSAIFSLFVERGNDRMRHNIGKQVSEWPPTSNFCRVVRNAIVHGGTINLNSETATGGEWRHLKYDYRHNGKHILNDGDLGIGDLVVLMLEMEADLINLNAPVDLG